MEADTTIAEIRAGVISSLVLAIGYLYFTGWSGRLHVCAFMVSVAVCFVSIMKSVVDLFVWAFGQTVAFPGRSLGRAIRLILGV